MSLPAYETLRVELPEEGVALVQIHRPDALNALNGQVMRELVDALERLSADEGVRCIVLTGDERAFAAGADIKEMAGATPIDIYLRDTLSLWERIRRIPKPIVAAVAGWCLGGGCELAMACDVVIAAENAQFGQPEIRLGVIPGAGGTQWLPRLIGKSRAMELVLTGRFIGAAEAERWGLVSRVVPTESLREEALKLAREIASRPPLAVRMAKEAVLRAYETPLSVGLACERGSFMLLFASEDQKEGMAAFIEKRRPQWKGR